MLKTVSSKAAIPKSQKVKSMVFWQEEKKKLASFCKKTVSKPL